MVISETPTPELLAALQVLRPLERGGNGVGERRVRIKIKAIELTLAERGQEVPQ